MLTLALATLTGGLAGEAVSLVLTRWRPRPEPTEEQTEPVPDEFTAAEIDRAATAWATAKGRPEAAGLMADKLTLLWQLNQRRRGR